MYNRFDRPLCLEVRPSRILLLAIALTHLAALLALLLAPLDAVAATLPVLLLVANAGRLYACYIGRVMPASIRRLGWSRAQGWHLPHAGDATLPVTLREPLFVSRCLLVARFSSRRYRHHSLLVLPDSMDADDFRRLRVRLLQCAHGDQ